MYARPTPKCPLAECDCKIKPDWKKKYKAAKFMPSPKQSFTFPSIMSIRTLEMFTLCLIQFILSQ